MKVTSFLRSQLKRLAGTPVVRKAFHTFWQTALAVFVAGVPLVVNAVGDQGLAAAKAALIALATAALAAGFSAAKTAVVEWYKGWK